MGTRLILLAFPVSVRTAGVCRVISQTLTSINSCTRAPESYKRLIKVRSRLPLIVFLSGCFNKSFIASVLKCATTVFFDFLIGIDAIFWKLNMPEGSSDCRYLKKEWIAASLWFLVEMLHFLFVSSHVKKSVIHSCERTFRVIRSGGMFLTSWQYWRSSLKESR